MFHLVTVVKLEKKSSTRLKHVNLGGRGNYGMRKTWKYIYVNPLPVPVINFVKYWYRDKRKSSKIWLWNTRKLKQIKHTIFSHDWRFVKCDFYSIIYLCKKRRFSRSLFIMNSYLSP
jgi:hypothetical protein